MIKKIYAYNLSGVRQESLEFNLHNDNSNAQKFIIYNNNFYILDTSDDLIYVYDTNGNRLEDQEIETLSEQLALIFGKIHGLGTLNTISVLYQIG